MKGGSPVKRRIEGHARREDNDLAATEHVFARLGSTPLGSGAKASEGSGAGDYAHPAAQQLAAADPAGVWKGQGAPPVSMRDNAQPDARAAVQLSSMPLDGLLIK
jgi:hypothetical protein